LGDGGDGWVGGETETKPTRMSESAREREREGRKRVLMQIFEGASRGWDVREAEGAG